jgi:branched-chain amino acid aminotransferase
MQTANSFRTTRCQTPKKKPNDTIPLKFGRQFTDHMFLMKYGENPPHWHSAEIRPYGPLELDPATACLHYGQAIFEGLKCYRTTANKLQLFRPRDNLRRMNQSAARLMMPEIDVESTLDAMKKLLKIDSDWVPSKPGTSLYIRPNMFGSEAFLGVHPAEEYIFTIILSPVGSYFTSGQNGVSIHVEEQFSRAAEGGTGGSKAAGNYAGSFCAAARATKEGCDQVLWLDGKEHRYIEEIGAMNVMFRIGEEILTPKLDGNFLAGITRDSVIQLLRHQDIQVSERRISIEEILSAIESKELKECFGTGTAAVVTPIGALSFRGTRYEIEDQRDASIARKIHDELTGIQYGTLPDPFGWIEKID